MLNVAAAVVAVAVVAVATAVEVSAAAAAVAAVSQAAAVAAAIPVAAVAVQAILAAEVVLAIQAAAAVLAIQAVEATPATLVAVYAAVAPLPPILAPVPNHRALAADLIMQAAAFHAAATINLVPAVFPPKSVAVQVTPKAVYVREVAIVTASPNVVTIPHAPVAM